METSKKETRLLRSLNKFIALISSTENSQTSQPNFRLISNFLRLNLLSYLRQYQQPDIAAESSFENERDLLVQWWITLLNYLNSDLNDNMDGQEKIQLSTEVISVSLECVSRILAVIMVYPGDHDNYTRDLDIYGYHLLLTVHYVTNRLIANTKRRRSLNGISKNPKVKGALAYINSYNSLLTAFMGKLMAFAFFYLDPALKYDFYVLRSFEPTASSKATTYEAFPWKTQEFFLVKDQVDDARSLVPDQNRKIFQVMISYLQNDSIFLTFYWHYWYITLKLLSCQHYQAIDPKSVPGLDLILRRVSRFFDSDMHVFRRYMKSQERDTLLLTKPHAGHSGPLSSEQLNNFVFVNFKTIKLWECVRSVVGCLNDQMPYLLGSLISLHDDLQLQQVGKIPAYDSVMANLIYNKILQFIIFQFDTTYPKYLDNLHWDRWCTGIINMLKTLNFNCQSVGLLCLFNIWKNIPFTGGLKSKIIHVLMEDLWDVLVTENYFDIVKVLFFKLVVFQMLSDPFDCDGISSTLVHEKMENVYQQALSLSEYANQESVPNNSKDALVFQVNKKLAICKPEHVDEETLIYDSDDKNKENKNSILFPRMIALSILRPSIVLHRGQYPFDVFDEMVLKAAKAAALKRKERKLELSSTRNFSVTSNISTPDSESSHDSIEEESQKGTITNALEAFFSKLGGSSSKSQNDSKKNATERISRGSFSIKHRNSVTSSITSSSRGDSESVEVLSMYSTISTTSSVSTSRSGSSLDLFNHQSQVTPNLPNQRTSQARDDIAKPASRFQQQKKRKLLAPPELKFSADKSDKQNISCIFRLINVPVSSPSSLTNLCAANNKWGVVSAQNYDKPLPLPGDLENNSTDKLRLEPFDTIGSDQLHLSSTQTCLSQRPLSQPLPQLTPKIVPRPNFLIFSPSCRRSDDFDERLTLKKLSLAEDTISLRAASEDMNWNTCENLTQRSMKTLEKSDSQTINQIQKSNVTMMCENTKFTRLINVIDIFNRTVEEWYEYLDTLYIDREGSAFMECDIILSRGSHINMKNNFNAKAEYL